MQAAPARFASVSDLYAADEVELLLDEIRELSPAGLRAEDIQDFEIAGSRASPSPPASQRSWDSHARSRRPPPAPPPALAPLYCRLRHLASAAGALRLALLACAGGACGCVWGAAGLRAWRLPLAGRVRALQLAALLTTLAHGALLALHVTRLTRVMPLRWTALGAAAATASSLALGAGAGVLLRALVAAPEYRGAPAPVLRPLLAAAGLALAGAALAASLALVEARAARAEGRRP